MINPIDFAETLPGIYSRAELERLWQLAVALPAYSVVVEIGVLYGRSTSVLFHAAKQRKLKLYLVDPWVVSEADTYLAFHKMVDQHFRDVPFTMFNMTSRATSWEWPFKFVIDLLHVDGDHSPKGIEADCWLAASLVRGRGVAVFHDYNTRDVPEKGSQLVFPQIKKTVDLCCAGWENLGVVDSQAAFRRKR